MTCAASGRALTDLSCFQQRQMQLMCDILVHDSKSSACLNDEQKSLLATFEHKGANMTLQRSTRRWDASQSQPSLKGQTPAIERSAGLLAEVQFEENAYMSLIIKTQPWEQIKDENHRLYIKDGCGSCDTHNPNHHPLICEVPFEPLTSVLLPSTKS